MAGDWIKMRADLLDDPAVFRMSKALGVDRYGIVGRLHTFWSWVDRHAVDGRVDGASSTDIDEVARLPSFASALIDVGWVEITDQGIVLPHYERHNGESAKERGLKNARQARWRAKKAEEATPSAPIPVDAPPSTDASTREDKRRVIPIVGKPTLPSRFPEFWGAWPSSARKVAKSECEKRWKARALDAQADQILAHVESSKQSRQWQDGFDPAPLTYLNQRRWEDGAGEEAAGGRIGSFL